MKRLGIFVVGAIVVSSFGLASAGSEQCANGDVPPSMTPAGVGIGRSGDPQDFEGSLHLCNNGAVVPAPGKGSVSVGGNLFTQSGYVEADGDANNSGADCTDGFTRVAVNNEGPHFYQSPNGNYNDTDPSKTGNQRAEEKTADRFANDTIADCS